MIADKLYKAINKAEMTGYAPDDQWIRTLVMPKQGSTAFGPVQITRGLLRGYKKYHKKLFSSCEIYFIDLLIKQGDEFLKHGRNKGKSWYKAEFDYGGTGDVIRNEESKQIYKDIATKMIQHHLDSNGGDWETAVRQWRFGMAEKDDPRYWDIVSREMGEPFRPSPYSDYGH